MKAGSFDLGTGARAESAPLEAAAPRAGVVAIAVRAAFAAFVAAAVALLPPLAGPYARTLAYGTRILDRGALGIAFGPEVYGGKGAPAGALGWFWALGNALAHRALGDVGGYALAAIAAGAAFALVTANARARAGTYAAGAASLVVLAAAAGGVRIGGNGFAWLACAAFLLALARARDAESEPLARRWIALAAAAAVLWCNSSSYGSAAALIALAASVGSTLSTGAGTDASRRSWLVTLAAAAATLATPALLTYPGLSFASLDFARLPALGYPVHPVEVDALAYRDGFVALAILLAILGVPRARRGVDVWVVGVALVAALCNGALLPLFAFAAAPVLAAAFRELGLGSEARTPANRGAAFAWATGAFAAIAFALSPRENAALARIAAPQSAALYASALSSQHRTLRIACERVERCGDVVALGDPDLRVLADDRILAAPQSVRDMQIAFDGLKSNWLTNPGIARADVLVVESGQHLDGIFGLDPKWKRLGGDDRVAIFERAVR